VRLLFPSIVAVLAGLGTLFLLQQPLREQIDMEGAELRRVAHDVAMDIDGAAHDRITSASDSEFLTIRTQLRVAHGRARLRSPLYTLRLKGDGTEFVAMTNPSPFVGHAYEYKEPMRRVFERGLPNQTGIYGDSHGRWISGYGAIADGDRVVGLVEADRPADDLYEQLWGSRALSSLVAMLAFLLAWFGRVVFSHDAGPAAAARRMVGGSLAARIGLAGAVPVLLAVGVVSSLQVRQAHRDGSEATRARLQSVVSVSAPRVDATLHAELVASGDASSPAFFKLRDQLRSIKEQAGLSTDVYTLRRDGDLTRFVAMTNEVPFLGDSYELRPPVKATFEGGGAGVEGPYGDEHGMWISAWAPIWGADGKVAAILQVDEDITAMMASATNRGLRDAMFALFAMLIAFGVGGAISASLARPILKIAGATQQIQEGRFEVDVPTDRMDEVGALARSVQEMATSLKEKERLRNMFGKYMAHQVVRDLLGRDELDLDGELVEITVLITDIRGYTALTEELGAAEVVGLLNEYFSILVDAVLENGGVIDKFMGDALLAWFGAPVPQADHRERAVKTAVTVLERCGEWNARRVEAGLQAVATGIGLAAGDVVVGNIGSEQRLEYTAIGDAVNLSSRLCGEAAGGEILATPDVAATDPRFEDIGRFEVKGVKEAVSVHRITVATVIDPGSKDATG
jgi:class 3 adenylate cyclase